MPRLVPAGQLAALRRRRGVSRNRHAAPTGRVPTERFLKAEALKVVAGRDAGRIPRSIAEAMLEMIRVEVREIMDRNLAVARGATVRPSAFIAPSAPKPMKRPQPKRKYERKQIMPAAAFRQIEEQMLADMQEPWTLNETDD